MARLRRSDPSRPGITRSLRGRGFSYRGPRGAVIRDEATLARIRALSIPPAWEQVWISLDERGHLQATGVDAAGRRQYLYHEDWRRRRDTQKYRRIESFARTLPLLRERVADDLANDDVDRDRVLACAVRLLDQAFFRVGSEEYAARNGSFGLATLRKSHLQLEGDTATFDFTAKSGKRRIQVVRDPEVAEVLRRLKRRRTGGVELLAYREDGRWRDLRSADINAYLKERCGEEHTAKDFRTWHATVLAAVDLASSGIEPTGPTAVRRATAATVRTVSEYLGNTPAVCRASYIDPRVFERFAEGLTVAPVLAELPTDPTEDQAARERIESAVLDLLGGERPALADAA
jgi:DNA topoisomerase-1